jgi:hypothetical protein
MDMQQKRDSRGYPFLFPLRLIHTVQQQRCGRIHFENFRLVAGANKLHGTFLLRCRSYRGNGA